MENRNAILPLVKHKCARSKIRWQLLDGIICAESAYDRYAMRYEPKHNEIQLPDKFSKLNRISLATEVQLQKFSWGLCQIMGTVARRLSFNGALPQLCDIDLNLTLGIKLLESLRVRYRFEDDILCAYNFGSAQRRADGSYVVQGYVDKVKSFMAINDV